MVLLVNIGIWNNLHLLQRRKSEIYNFNGKTNCLPHN